MLIADSAHSSCALSHPLSHGCTCTCEQLNVALYVYLVYSRRNPAKGGVG